MFISFQLLNGSPLNMYSLLLNHSTNLFSEVVNSNLSIAISIEKYRLKNYLLRATLTWNIPKIYRNNLFVLKY